ncbi:MrpH family fimbial adhesin [Pseudomonas mucidolens]|uniref:Fimbrial adhesin MrpH C-terminal domain-containing protein n=1 Tax=Pseudomonas mucidolens TaxID=46679 RepID=A0A1H2N4A7_9PSED|nr:hypothetical protein SAMN05216202_2859 [Pseudomonas mucidolens]SQH32761.1 Uncharacterised protein [Pseudomonas mucidolens]
MRKFYSLTFRCIVVLVLLYGAAEQAQAYNIITTESRYEPGGVRYFYVVQDWTSGGRSPCSTEDSRMKNCNIYLATNHGAVRPYEWKVPTHWGNSTMGTLLSDLMRVGFRVPFYGSTLVPHASANNRLCISFSFSQTGPNIGGGVSLFGPCTKVVPPSLQCEIKGDTTINHRNLPDNALNGAKASTQLDLQCRGPASVTVSASRTNSSGVQLRSDGSLYSRVTINGKDATTGINVKVSDGLTTKLDITSTLSSSGTVAPGEFSGSTVITISPP